MRVLITGSQSRLGGALARAFAHHHEVRTLDLTAVAGEPAPTYVGDPRDQTVAARAVSGCDAIIHLVPLAAADASPLDLLDAATRGAWNLITAAAPGSRFILLSSLRIFERYPVDWWVTEHWAPRPTTDVRDLAPYLAELVVREAARVLPLTAIALRLGEIVDDAEIRGRVPDSRWLHIEDAVQAVTRALTFEREGGSAPTGWSVFHIPGGGPRPRFPLALAGREPFGYMPRHDVTTGAALPYPMASEKDAPSTRTIAVHRPPATRVVIYGAGGALAAVTADALAPDHILRLTDVRPLAAIIADYDPPWPGAPTPRLLDAPHEMRVVDVTDPDQVREAARGMDAIINSTVVRAHPVQSFRVNTLGAYNVMRAAVACGIRRVVQTGPRMLLRASPVGYAYDFDLVDDVPMRPGTHLYFMSKFLGHEICRIFAEEYDLEVPTLLFSRFINPALPVPEPVSDDQMLISWEDGGAAVRQAVDVPSFPRPFEVLQITADVPNGRYRNEKAKRLLAWQPRDRLEARWHRRWE